ncbi:hypothetical protein AGR5A_Lc30035 [Agrobacterium genomosp. 5 str. CFBP 6626]|nr:hypothetical protein AGR5A_Lc30035 [Agrobacterium genomosp. 5 str. CFBP 6626]
MLAPHLSSALPGETAWSCSIFEGDRGEMPPLKPADTSSDAPECVTPARVVCGKCNCRHRQ